MSHPFQQSRLIAVLNRLASPHDGERAAAGLLATKMLQDAGLTWDRIVQAPIGPYAGAADEPIVWNGRRFDPPHGGRWVETALYLFKHAVITRSPRITEADAEWIKRRVPVWRNGKQPRPDEAARLSAIYAAVMGDWR